MSAPQPPPDYKFPTMQGRIALPAPAAANRSPRALRRCGDPLARATAERVVHAPPFPSARPASAPEPVQAQTAPVGDPVCGLNSKEPLPAAPQGDSPTSAARLQRSTLPKARPAPARL